VNLGNTLPDRIARNAAEARKLSGLELTPETVWNLAPWSWAVDWEGNIGDVLHNVSRFSQDGLVMRYGYIMQQKTAEIDYTLSFNGRLNRSPKTDLRLKVIAESKIRRRATPFGFGFDMTALTGRQSAILGALGISRGPRHL
jgi:roadblock/LC7 domain-containing protein